MDAQTLRANAFKALHERASAFVIPNPWDAGSAKMLAGLGFEALATTSAGYAFSLGRPDGAAGLDDTLANVRAIVAATDLPVAVDLEPTLQVAQTGPGRLAGGGHKAGHVVKIDPAEPRRDAEFAIARAVVQDIDSANWSPALTAEALTAYLGSGDITKADTYHITIATGTDPVTAIRLEALPDPSLPRHGPGMAYYEGPKGDFFMGEFRVSSAEHMLDALR